MAKKKRGKKKSHRRRRVGAVHPAIMSMATNAGGIIAGGVAAAFVNSAIKKSMATAPAFTGGAVAVAAGLALPMFVKGNKFVESMGDGMIAMGGAFILNETFLSIPGISGLPVMPGMTNARPGYVTKAVGRMPMRRRVGSLDSLKVIGQLTDN
jgi:hypothetical protein